MSEICSTFATLFDEKGFIMIDHNAHIDLPDVPESPVSLFMRGVAGMMHEKDIEVYRIQQRCTQMEEEMEAKAIDPSPVVAEGKQKKLIAILNAIYEDSYITCSKKEFMQRIATALGCPGIADYNKALYNVKNTYQYEEIFTNLAQVAHNEILKNG